MRKFRKGQKVVCVHPTGMWLGIFAGPFHNDIVTISKYSAVHSGYIELEEYPTSRSGRELPDCFAQSWFEPLVNINEIKVLLESEPISK